MGNIYFERVQAIRRMMADNGWDAVVIGASDPHSSEYPAPRWQAVQWVSGFTGEAGDIVITADHAGLWTDSRYFIQALEQLQGTGIELHKTRQPDSVTIPEWLAGRAGIVAVDGTCMSVSYVREIEKAVASAQDDRICKVVDVPDMLDSLWTDRPRIPVSPIVTIGEDDAGESRQDKIRWLRDFLKDNGCTSILLSSLDEVAWLLNVRGSDIEYNPFVISYLYVSADDIIWFVQKDNARIPDQDTVDSFEELRSDGVEICSYDETGVRLAAMDQEAGRMFIDPSAMNDHM